MVDAIQPEQRFYFGHRLARLTGRNPIQGHRAATPLELLFDLTFVVAFGQASDQFAHAVAAGHFKAAIIGFVFVIVATCWAWVNFSWFSSAYDTDDWFFRVTTMVQMIGVIMFALGIPAMFASLAEHHPIDNGVMVIGYVIMRIAMIVQWLRAARDDPGRRPTAIAYAISIGVAQVGWVILAILHTPTDVFIVVSIVLFFVEFIGPWMAERKSTGTPWHPEHIAERYALLTIIALGEGIFGTVAAVTALVDRQGWSVNAVLVVVAGIGLTFGLWWSYFMIPSGPVLVKFRQRAKPWGYSHFFIYGSIVATGAGPHIAAYVIEGDAEIGVLGAIVAVAVPVLIFSIALFALYAYLVRELDPFHIVLFAATVVFLVVAIVLAALGAPIGLSLMIITLSPAIVVVGYEVLGARHEPAVLQRVLG
ncbi:low temperature requirement protein A [Glaciihabitans sp. dw_435]|uniref:low temperature requirement protein A n=1 Tax=Glaciihabitans sp. dw_435 TaxID=2720081 RepID=UPI001BD1EF95|nr:low temperature requirement protein A [Glaciihabitans sp. dw_435]